MSYFAILFKLKSSQKIFLKKLFPPNLVGKSVAIYGKCGNVRIRVKIKGISTILENKVWRKVWQSEIKYGNNLMRSNADRQTRKIKSDIQIII